MENQRIQKLVKLAYIADIHGDYKIADKIFEKLAATPPPRFREFGTFMRWALGKFGSIDNLKTRVEDLNALKLNLEKIGAEDISQAVIDTDYEVFTNAQKRLPKLREELAKLERELEALNRGTNDRAKAAKNLEIVNKKEAIENNEKSIAHFGPIFGHMNSRPVAYKQIDDELKKINEEIQKVLPDIKELPSNDPRRIALQAMAKHLDKVNEQALQEARSSLGPLIKEEKVTIRETGPKAKIKGVELGSDTTTTRETTKRYFDFWGALARPGQLTYRMLSDQWQKVKIQDTLLKSTPEEAVGFGRIEIAKIPIDSPKVPFLRDTLGEMIKLYDTKFIYAFRDAVKELKKDYASGGIRKFDIDDRGHFTEAANRAFEILKAQDPTVQIFYGLFESIKTFVRDQKVIAKAQIEKAGATANDKTILDNILKRYPNLLRDTGIDYEEMKNMISRGTAFSIEDFLDFRIGSVNKVDSKSLAIFKASLQTGLEAGLISAAVFAALYPFRNTWLAKKGLDIITNKEGRERAEAKAAAEAERRQLERDKQALEEEKRKALKARGLL